MKLNILEVKKWMDKKYFKNRNFYYSRKIYTEVP